MLKHAPPKFFGTRLVNGQVCFRLWAPNQERVSLLLEGYGPNPMQNAGNGWGQISPASTRVAPDSTATRRVSAWVSESRPI